MKTTKKKKVMISLSTKGKSTKKMILLQMANLNQGKTLNLKEKENMVMKIPNLKSEAPLIIYDKIVHSLKKLLTHSPIMNYHLLSKKMTS